MQHGLHHHRDGTHLLLPPPFLLFFGCLGLLVLPNQVGEISHIFVSLLQKVRQTPVFLLIDQFPIALFIFSLLRKEEKAESVTHLWTAPFHTPLSAPQPEA